MPSAAAHTLRPAIVDVVLKPDGTAAVQVQANAEALVAGIGPQHEDSEDAPQADLYNRLRQLEPPALAGKFAAFEPRFGTLLTLEFDGTPAALSFVGIDIPAVGDVRDARLSEIHYTADIPSGASTVGARYPAQFGDAVIRFAAVGDGDAASNPMRGRMRPPAPRPPRELAIVTEHDQCLLLPELWRLWLLARLDQSESGATLRRCWPSTRDNGNEAGYQVSV